MHILWINQHAAPVGGCERYIQDTARMLKERNVRSTLLYEVAGQTDARWLTAFDAAFPQVDIAQQISDIKPDLIYIHRLDSIDSLQQIINTAIPAVRFFHDHRLFCLREHKYTVIGNVTCTRQSGLICYPCLGFLNKSPHWPGIELRRVKTLLSKQEVNKKLAAFITGSRYMARHIELHGFDPEKIYSIPLYSVVPPIDKSIKRENDLLLFAGQLNTGKGLDILIEALRKIERNFRLVVAGTGNQEKYYKELSRQYKLTDKIHFAGKLGNEELDEYYQKATALIFPSRAPETFGLVGLEAMSFGLPVIASRVGGIDEWLVDRETGFFFSISNPGELADKIIKIMDNPDLVKTMGEKAKARYFEKFLPENHVNQLLRLFESLLKNKGILS